MASRLRISNLFRVGWKIRRARLAFGRRPARRKRFYRSRDWAQFLGAEPTERFSIACYPKGIPPQSPGLRGTSYPGNPRARGLNSEGVAPLETYNAMPQSLSAVSIHLVFSTKDRRPFLRDKSCVRGGRVRP